MEGNIVNLQLSAPKPLSSSHRLDDFFCGESSLDDWLKRRALSNHLNGASRTFVIADSYQHVWGYYALATGAISHNEATGRVRRNMPEPIPVIVLGRLAIDLRAQGRKLGASLLQDAVIRVRVVAENTGVRALLVHALNDKAKQFYEYYGFTASPISPMTLMLRL
nr:GNAT family N-acetyltransferase [Providencia sp. PROV257]